MSCQSQVYSKVNLLYAHISALFFRFFSHIGHYRPLSRVPCAVPQVLTSRSCHSFLSPVPSSVSYQAHGWVIPSTLLLPVSKVRACPSLCLAPTASFSLFEDKTVRITHTKKLKILFSPSSLFQTAGNTSLLSWILTPRILKLVLLSELMADNFLFTTTPLPPQELRACL